MSSSEISGRWWDSEIPGAAVRVAVAGGAFFFASLSVWCSYKLFALKALRETSKYATPSDSLVLWTVTPASFFALLAAAVALYALYRLTGRR